MKTVAFVRTTNIYDDSRATKEISALLDGGYRVVILGWSRDGEAEEKTKRLFEKRNIEIKFYNCILKNGIGMKNIYKLIGWICWSKRELEKIDTLNAVHACNLDCGLGSYLYCRKNNVPLVYDIYDYYIDSHNIPSKAMRIIESLEIQVIDFAKTTIICTEERMEQIRNGQPKSVLVLHNSPDIPVLETVDEIYDYSYCGSLCDLRLIKEILYEYQYHTDLHFAFAGNDKYKADVQSLASQYDNLEFFGTVPYSEVLKIEQRTKVMSAIYEPSIRNHRLCAPNKFYEALALGKPLIVCKGTGIDSIVEKNQLGIVIPYSAASFYNAIERLLSSPKLMKEMGERGRELYEKKYRWSIMKKRLIEMYDNVLSEVN